MAPLFGAEPVIDFEVTPNRPDWLDQAQGWRDRTKALEERLSDVLHERLTARFVDRRTTALMRALNVTEDTVADVVDGRARVLPN